LVAEAYHVAANHYECMSKAWCADAFFSEKDAGCRCEKLALGAKSIENGRNVN
jgi:hypothetical protein